MLLIGLVYSTHSFGIRMLVGEQKLLNVSGLSNAWVCR